MSGFKNRDSSVLKNLLFLRDDLLNNKVKSFSNHDKSLNALSEIINEELYKKNYNVILDFIKLSFENGLIDNETVINLSFYILEKCNDYGLEKSSNEEIEVVELEKNDGSVLDNRRKLEDVFSKYGYVYDRDSLNRCGGEENFVKYSNIGYVDYVLSKFKRYGIVKDELYRKKSFYNIIIDDDKDTFNSILDFVDHNECSLSKVYDGMPVIVGYEPILESGEVMGIYKSKSKDFLTPYCWGTFILPIIRDIYDTENLAVNRKQLIASAAGTVVAERLAAKITITGIEDVL